MAESLVVLRSREFEDALDAYRTQVNCPGIGLGNDDTSGCSCGGCAGTNPACDCPTCAAVGLIGRPV